MSYPPRPIDMLKLNPATSTHYEDCWRNHPLCMVGFLAERLAATPTEEER